MLKWPSGLRKLQKLGLKALVYVHSWRLAFPGNPCFKLRFSAANQILAN